MKHRLLTTLALITVVPALMLAAPGLASAHGYVSAPPSRQAECAQKVLDCGDITYEPQSVEGPKGLRSCSGGNSRFAELDDDSKPWQAREVGHRVTFTWTFTAAHRTTNFEYYLGGVKVADISGGNTQPPQGLQHTVDLGGASGRQRLLAVWNIADTGNAFYSCIDVNITG